MQSRRREDYSTLSPASKPRDQHRFKRGSNPYNGSRRDALERSPRNRQSLSPNRLDGSRRVVGASRRSSSTERRDYAWHVGGGSGARSDRMRSRSPPFEQVQKRAQLDEGDIVMGRDYVLPMEFRRRYELSEHNDFKVGDDSLKSKNVYGYQNSSHRIGKDIEFSESRLSAGGGRGMLAQKSMAVEDVVARGSYRLPQDLGPTSRYGETRGHISSSSQGVDIRQFEHERLQYRDPIAVDKLPIMDSYKDEEKHIFQSRDMAYPIGSASHSKDFASTSPLKDLTSSSSRMLRNEFLGSYQDGVRLPPHSDGFSRSSGKLIDPIGFNAYGQNSLTDSAGGPEAGHRNLTYFQRGAYSPTRVDCEEYPYPKLRETANDDRGYPSDDLYRMMPSRAPLDYDNAKIDYGRRDLSRPSLMHPVVNRVDDNNQDSYGNPRKGIILDHPTLQKQAVSDYVDMNRTSNASNQGGEYFDSGCNQVEFGRRVSQDYENSHFGASQDHQISHLRSDYGFGKDAGPKFLKERLHSPPVSIYDTDMHRRSLRMQRMKKELHLCEPSDRVLKRMYSVVEELGAHDSTKLMSKWNARGELQDLYDSGEEWIDEDTSVLYSSDAVGFDRNEYRKSRRIHDRLEYRQDFVTDDRLSSQDSFAHRQRHSVRLYKHGGRYTRDHPKIGSLSSQDLHHFDRRSGLQKQPNVWKRNDDYQEDVHEDYDDPSEDWADPLESEPAEDSEEFKLLVHEAFLKYSKQLNGNLSVQKRYKEQGKAGSLFCIVCGRRFVFFSVIFLVKRGTPVFIFDSGIPLYFSQCSHLVCTNPQDFLVLDLFGIFTWLPAISNP